MTLISAVSLFLSMAVLAAIPSTSVLVVTARAVSGGFFHGAMAALGVVVGDIILIAMVIFGLGILLEFFGDFAYLSRYFGGAYLVWLGVTFVDL
jgi:threonine/homoserine/homoserine lactone efflux protein